LPTDEHKKSIQSHIFLKQFSVEGNNSLLIIRTCNETLFHYFDSEIRPCSMEQHHVASPTARTMSLARKVMVTVFWGAG
jgi:hypothetical protein